MPDDFRSRADDLERHVRRWRVEARRAAARRFGHEAAADARACVAEGLRLAREWRERAAALPPPVPQSMRIRDQFEDDD